MRRELGNSDQALDLLPRDFRLVTSGLRHGNDREQYCEHYPIFSGRPVISVLSRLPITRDLEPSSSRHNLNTAAVIVLFERVNSNSLKLSIL